MAVPAPSYVIVTSDKSSPIQPVGSDVTVSCSVGLQRSATEPEIPLTLNMQITDPDGNQLVTVALPVDESTLAYTTEVTVYSFERDQSGVYTCEAFISSTFSFLTDSNMIPEEIVITSGE